MTKPSSFEMVQISRELSNRANHFPWALVDPVDMGALAHDAQEIREGRLKEIDALMRQCRACHDAKQRLSQHNLFSAWVHTQTTISKRTAYRMTRCWNRLGHYHFNAVDNGEVSPLMRYDYGTVLYVLSDPALCPDELLDELLAQTFELISQGKTLYALSRKSILDTASRWRHSRSEQDAMQQEQAANQGLPDRTHLRIAYRDAAQDQSKLEGGALPQLAGGPQKDHHGNPVPPALEEVFMAREHFARIRQSLKENARQLHALMHTPAGKHLHRHSTQRLLSIAEDINLSCPVLVEKNNKWVCTKTLVRRTYGEIYRANQPTTGSESDPGSDSTGTAGL